MLLTLALAPWVTNLLILVLLGVAVLLVLTVLIQRPQGGGLSAAFGSAGSGQTAFGTKTGDALTVFTVIMFTLFVLAAITLNYMMRPAEAPTGESIQRSPTEPLPAPGTTGDSTAPTGVDLVPVTPPTELPATDPAATTPPNDPAPATETPSATPPEQPAEAPPSGTPPEQPKGAPGA